MITLSLFLCVFLSSLIGLYGSNRLSITPQSDVELDEILLNGISNRTYPGVAAIAGDVHGKIFYASSFGTYEYLNEKPNSPSVDLTYSLFDLASVTKVVSTTSAVALLYQGGYLKLDDKIGALLNEEEKYSKTGGKENVTVLNCLLHNAGYQPDPVPGYWETSFGCKNTKTSPAIEDFSCYNQIYESVLAETLVTPPGAAYVYSDLSFMTLELVVGSIVSKNKEKLLKNPGVNGLHPKCQENNAYLANKGMYYTCHFEAFVRQRVFEYSGNSKVESSSWLSNTTYLPDDAIHSACVTTQRTNFDTSIFVQGQVSDSNCYTSGGICGHAGIFSTAPDVAQMLYRWARLTSYNHVAEEKFDMFPGWINSTTARLFTTEYDNSQSSRALGWTTNDPTVTDFGYSNSCGTFSTKTFMHIGYTGTCICVDPVHGMWSVVLTNRVYEMGTGSSDAVKAVYRSFNSKIVEKFQSH